MPLAHFSTARRVYSSSFSSLLGLKYLQRFPALRDWNPLKFYQPWCGDHRQALRSHRAEVLAETRHARFASLSIATAETEKSLLAACCSAPAPFSPPPPNQARLARTPPAEEHQKSSSPSIALETSVRRPLSAAQSASSSRGEARRSAAAVVLRPLQTLVNRSSSLVSCASL
ncbi:hypothetical protein BCR35DRAFT_303520 [Leucosporidium creatinivorum]|uniref:Uncharacterized protein n=1 Tax=Leucosporidium creatinivorum TaxID=106004 RepID=A0A1Y2FH09_9BASI|nr:hypothetical protein BCR35DRAFT_303520 [Leucosporidium creatinivorum]